MPFFAKRDGFVIQLALFDIDGTLYDEQTHCFPASAVLGLEELKRRAIRTVVATGRIASARETLAGVGIYPDAMVCVNGHVLIDGAGAVLDQVNFPLPLAREVEVACREAGIGLIWKYWDCAWVCLDVPAFSELMRIPGKKIYSDSQRPCPNRAPNGGYLACNLSQQAWFNRRFQGRCRCIDINGKSADLLLWNVNKKTGVASLLQRWEIPPETCIAFGDNRNDIELISYVGIGVAMGNAEAELKACADYITGSAGEDGIYNGLQHFGLI